jgi:hypothetical protein
MYELRATTMPAGTASLKTVAALCGVSLAVSLLLASYGLDVSAGFF